ncbi:uncharacterized protein LOC134729835 [Pan paniscus]|uniref:uncharacterized protein LOC134729835 n=1 Tax=Pan paniscus TaxID=9597 RepID=UPI003005135D
MAMQKATERALRKRGMASAKAPAWLRWTPCESGPAPSPPVGFEDLGRERSLGRSCSSGPAGELGQSKKARRAPPPPDGPPSGHVRVPVLAPSLPAPDACDSAPPALPSRLDPSVSPRRGRSRPPPFPLPPPARLRPAHVQQRSPPPATSREPRARAATRPSRASARAPAPAPASPVASTANRQFEGRNGKPKGPQGPRPSLPFLGPGAGGQRWTAEPLPPC